MTLHHPKKSLETRRQISCANAKHRRESRQTHYAPPVDKTWLRMSGRDMDGIRLDLGLSELDMALLLGIERQNYLALQNGGGMITGPAVKLLALLRSMPIVARKACVAFLMSTQPGRLGALDNSQPVGAIIPPKSTD